MPLRTASASQLLAEFFALFGWSTAGPVSDPWRFFGHELPVITRWCPSGPQLNQATLPVLIMEGEKSPALLRNIGQRLAAQLGNATLITLENQDNQALWSEPRLIAAEITAFIDETEAKTQGRRRVGRISILLRNRPKPLSQGVLRVVISPSLQGRGRGIGPATKLKCTQAGAFLFR